MPRRNRVSRPWTRRTRAAQLAPPEPPSTPPQLAQRLVSRGWAHAVILEMGEAFTPRQGTDAQP